MTLNDRERNELARLEKLARWLDSEYRLPLGIRVGWDGIIGLIPVVGEMVTTIISAYLIGRAAILGASTPVLLRMGLNVVVDDLISLVPFFGWIGDFFWRSNLRNLELFRRHLLEPIETRRRSTWVLSSVVAVIFAAAMTFALLIGILAWVVGVFLYGLMTNGIPG